MTSSSQRFHNTASPRQVLNVQRGKIPVRAVGSFLPQLTRKAFEKFGFSTATLITDWPLIAGAEVARFSEPERLKWPRLPGEAAADGVVETQRRQGATLVLRVDEARALDIQYKAKQLIERINSYFGYAAVADIRIIQGPIERTHGAGRRAASASHPAKEPAGPASGPLQQALARLEASVRASG
ncbi:MAG: DciA family protein [Hyphomicrobiaceae bacterium]|nr:DciA family protein [Hyphomicrobiaceae bacterium]